MKAFVRWAGSKKALLPELRAYWPGDQTRYIEPFCGSACLFFDLEPAAATLGDINPEIITTYRSIRHDPTRILECLRRYRKSRATYNALRSINPAELSDVEVAARFLFLNRLCFNGIYRTNRAGMFNVPYAKPKHAVKFDEEALLQASELLKRVELRNNDFEDVLSTAAAGDFVYLDPPYAVANRRVFAEYHPDSFSNSDLDRLASSLRSLHDRQVNFVVSYADSEEGRTLAAPWNVRRVRTRRNVAGFAGDRRYAFELLATNMELH
jgi:DNA adenine methylase